MVPEVVDRIKVCVPIKIFLNHAILQGYHIELQEVEDYHFNQLRFIIRSSTTPENLPELNDGIISSKPNIYTCECHWSRVEVVT
jgi:hypothetical protein